MSDLVGPLLFPQALVSSNKVWCDIALLHASVQWHGNLPRTVRTAARELGLLIVPKLKLGCFSGMFESSCFIEQQSPTCWDVFFQSATVRVEGILLTTCSVKSYSQTCIQSYLDSASSEQQFTIKSYKINSLASEKKAHVIPFRTCLVAQRNWPNVGRGVAAVLRWTEPREGRTQHEQCSKALVVDDDRGLC